MRHYLPAIFTSTLLLAASCTTPATPRPDSTQAAAQLQTLGAQVTVNDNAPGKPVTSINLSDVPITDATLAILDSFPHLEKLDLGHTKKLKQQTITDAGLAHVEKLTDLRRLSLTSTAVTDAGLAHLKPLAQLESLNLEQTKITDAGLPHLAGLAKLQTLKLQGTAVTEEGVKTLQKSLPNCKITF